MGGAAGPSKASFTLMNDDKLLASAHAMIWYSADVPVVAARLEGNYVFSGIQNLALGWKFAALEGSALGFDDIVLIRR